jgi:hypothetical protein
MAKAVLDDAGDGIADCLRNGLRAGARGPSIWIRTVVLSIKRVETSYDIVEKREVERSSLFVHKVQVHPETVLDARRLGYPRKTSMILKPQ